MVQVQLTHSHVGRLWGHSDVQVVNPCLANSGPVRERNVRGEILPRSTENVFDEERLSDGDELGAGCKGGGTSAGRGGVCCVDCEYDV